MGEEEGRCLFAVTEEEYTDAVLKFLKGLKLDRGSASRLYMLLQRHKDRVNEEIANMENPLS